MLSRLYPDPQTETEKFEMKEIVRAVAHNHPELFTELQPSIRQLRTAARDYGLARPAGEPFTSIPALSVSGPLVNAAVESFGRKLFSALYYKHARRILKRDGGVAVRWYSNLQIDADEIPRELGDVLSQFPKLERARMNLDDQFFYRWAVTENSEAAGFLAVFRRSFAMIGYVQQNVAAFRLPEHARILQPYDTQQALAADARKASRA